MKQIAHRTPRKRPPSRRAPSRRRLSEDALDAAFSALADRTRRAILARLASGEASVTELCVPFEMSQPAVSKHLRVLEQAGLVTRSRDAQRRPCRLDPAPLRDLSDWLGTYRAFWEESDERLDALLVELSPKESSNLRKKARNRR